jgi:hypothetical protein
VLVCKRFSVSNPGQVTGYAVALPGDTTKDGGPVWYGGGRLAADLSWPKLRQRWTTHRVTPGAAGLTAKEQNAVWDHATRTAADATAQIRAMAWTDPAAAADAYDRAARPPYGRIPPPSPAGNQLRQAARLLSAFAGLTGDRSMTPIVLITRLAALAEAVAELRDAQQHAAQAAAARAAAERLHAAAHPAPPAKPRPAQRADTAAQLAGQSFPPASDTTSNSTARSGPGRTATTATATTTQATWPHLLTLRAQPSIRYAGSSARTLQDAPRRHLAASGEHLLPHALPLRRLRHVHGAAGTPGVTGANWRMATSGSCHVR